MEDPKTTLASSLPDEVLVKDYLVDKKVLDIEDREVEVVYDIRMVKTNGKVYVSDVDISRYGLLRQIGLKSLANYFYQRTGDHEKRLIPWSYVQALTTRAWLPAGPGQVQRSERGVVGHSPRPTWPILSRNWTASSASPCWTASTRLHASDTLEEIDPAVQRDIVFSLKKERVAQLIGDMTPGQAADILSVLPGDEKTGHHRRCCIRPW